MSCSWLVGRINVFRCVSLLLYVRINSEKRGYVGYSQRHDARGILPGTLSGAVHLVKRLTAWLTMKTREAGAPER